VVYSRTEAGPVLGVRTAAMVEGMEDILRVLVFTWFGVGWYEGDFWALNWEVSAVRRRIVVVCDEGDMRWKSRRGDIHKLVGRVTNVEEE
jgi:hypothetical protein